MHVRKLLNTVEISANFASLYGEAITTQQRLGFPGEYFYYTLMVAVEKAWTFRNDCKPSLWSSCPSCHCTGFSIWTQAEITVGVRKGTELQSWEGCWGVDIWVLQCIFRTASVFQLQWGFKALWEKPVKPQRTIGIVFPESPNYVPLVGELISPFERESGVAVKLLFFLFFFLVKKIFPTVYSVHYLLLR